MDDEDEESDLADDSRDDADDEDEGRPHWQEAADQEIRSILETAEFDLENGSVAVSYEDWDPKGGHDRRRFESLDALRDALVKIGDARILGDVPFEDGEAVFDTDSDDLVGQALADFRIEEFFESAQQPEDGELLLEAADLAASSGLRAMQLEAADANAAIIEYLAKHPDLMYELDPRRFEEVVAAIFRDLGYEVVLTPCSRDGGHDLKAYRKEPYGTLLTLVECKRYHPEHKVGVGIVRALYGVVERECATHGIIATTSFFTRGAIAEHEQLRFRLGLSDFHQVVQWCQQYGKRRK